MDNIADHLVATALTANSQILLVSAGASETTGELARAVRCDVARIRGCWRLLGRLQVASKPGLDRWRDWTASGCDVRSLHATADWLAGLVGKDKTRNALMRFATVGEQANSCSPAVHEFATRLIAHANADSEAWRAIDTRDAGAIALPASDEDRLVDALLTALMERWVRGSKRAQRCERAWREDQSLKSVRKLGKHAQAFSGMATALGVEDSLAQAGDSLASQLDEALELDRLRQHPGLASLTGKDAVRVRSAIDVGMRQLMQKCMKLCTQLYGRSRDSVELEVRLALDSVRADRQLELAELPGRQVPAETDRIEDVTAEKRQTGARTSE